MNDRFYPMLIDKCKLWKISISFYFLFYFVVCPVTNPITGSVKNYVRDDDRKKKKNYCSVRT